MIPVEQFDDVGNPSLDPLTCKLNFEEEIKMAGTRKIIDCRQFPAEKPCSIAISGTEEEVLELAVLHARQSPRTHGQPELRGADPLQLQDETASASEAA